MAVTLCLVLLARCGSNSSSAGTGVSQGHRQVEQYLKQIEPLRLGVNRLLERADPILEAWHRHHISNQVAATRMSALERRFAAYTVAIAAIQPTNGRLRGLHRGYAHTYILEDSYLSALVSGLAGGHLDGLPTTQSDQRAAIISWRTALAVVAGQTGTPLPSDLQQAGRGEIAPSLVGS